MSEGSVDSSVSDAPSRPPPRPSANSPGGEPGTAPPVSPLEPGESAPVAPVPAPDTSCSGLTCPSASLWPVPCSPGPSRPLAVRAAADARVPKSRAGSWPSNPPVLLRGSMAPRDSLSGSRKSLGSVGLIRTRLSFGWNVQKTCRVKHSPVTCLAVIVASSNARPIRTWVIV